MGREPTWHTQQSLWLIQGQQGVVFVQHGQGAGWGWRIDKGFHGSFFWQAVGGVNGRAEH